MFLCYNITVKYQTNMAESAPLALKQLDATIGSRTVDGYSTAVDRYPHLGGMAVLLDPQDSAFQPSKLGLAGSHIRIVDEPAKYQDEIIGGITKARMGEFSAFYHEKGITPSIPELVTATFLHELGHGEDYYRYILRAGGDVAAAFKLSNEVRASQLAGLPLKAPSSAAKKAWDNNTDGYRDDMQKTGYDEARFQVALLDNIRAYSKLPCEKVADRFALGVLATMYSK